MLSIVDYILKFQDNLLNQKKNLLIINCKTTKDILDKDGKNLTFKHIFPPWQALLAILILT